MKLSYYIFAVIFSTGCLFSAAFGQTEKAKELYVNLCLQCHGATGLGDGPVGAALPAEMKPRNFKEGSFKFATDLTKFTELLQKGGAAVGLNALMPPQPTLTTDDIKLLYEYVISLKTS